MKKLPSHKHTNYENRLNVLENEVRELKTRLRYRQMEYLNIYSSDTLICVGRDHKNWHRIVCKYDERGCVGTPNPHWTSNWEMRIDGFFLVGFIDQDWKGWHGEYTTSELRYDEIPRDLLARHIAEMKRYIATLSFWLPCHIYNDVTGDLFRP